MYTIFVSHYSEIRNLFSKKCSSKMLKNLLYLMYFSFCAYSTFSVMNVLDYVDIRIREKVELEEKNKTKTILVF